jgi:hypothetical protein
VNSFRGFLVPQPDWIKVLYLFGTLGLHRLLTKTLKFVKNLNISKSITDREKKGDLSFLGTKTPQKVSKGRPLIRGIGPVLAFKVKVLEIF